MTEAVDTKKDDTAPIQIKANEAQEVSSGPELQIEEDLPSKQGQMLKNL